MGEDQEINPESNADISNSVPAESKETKKDAKRRQSPQKKKSKNAFLCEVVLLDGTELTIEVEKSAHGEVLFSKVVENIGIIDKEYFGLRFVKDKSPTQCWLQHTKPIKKQLKIGELKFQFAVKFYEPEPGKHLDEYTRYLLYLQLREDIVYGRLGCQARTYVLLGSFTAQAEFGDYDPEEHGPDYLAGYQFGPEEAEKEPNFIKRIIELHKEHRGQNPAEAELNFLEVAKRTPRYGIDIHYARRKKGEAVEVGISHKGIIVFDEDGEAIDSYGWRAVDLVAYKKRKFMLKLFKSEKKKNPRFTLLRRRNAKNLYKSAIEHHSFFRLTQSDPTKRTADSFIIGSKFRYSDRTLYQIRSDPSIHERQSSGKFSRSPSKRPRSKADRKRVVRAKPTTEDEKREDEAVDKDKEPEGDFEEIEIDESQPDHEKYDTSEWIIIEKELPDGTKKRYRRRVITTTTTSTKTTYVIRKGTEEMGHMMEEKPIESPRKEEIPEEKRESPEVPVVSEKEIEEEEKRREAKDDHHQHHEIVTTVITEQIITTPEKKETEEEIDGKEDTEIKQMSLTDIKAASKKPSAAVKPLMREDIEGTTATTTTTTTATKVLVYNVDKEETVKIVTKEEREEELKRRELEEEQRRLDEIRARNEREAAQRRKWKEEQQQKELEELEEKQKEIEAEEEAEEEAKKRALSPELQEISLSTGNEEFDKEFGIKDMDRFLIKTSPMPSQFLRELDEQLNLSNDPDDDDDDDDTIKPEKSQSLDRLPVGDTRKARTLDRKFVRRPPPERSSGYIRRSYGNELDFDYSPGSGARTMPRKTRKYVPLITKEELMRAYSSGGLHDESVIRNKPEQQEEKSKIEYSLKEESGVEQGEQGFVKSLIGRHETIKIKENEEIEERRRSRVYSSTDDTKGVVPTRSASFANVEKPEARKTKIPPPVKTKPVVFHPDKSGQTATAEVRPASAQELSSSPVVAESSPSDKNESVQKFVIPEVTTSTVVFDSEAPTIQKTTSGYIDKDCVEQLWGKVVLKQRRSFRSSQTFDGIPNFDLLKLKERGFISINEDHQLKELSVMNILAPEIILDKQNRTEMPRTCNSNDDRIITDEISISEMVISDVFVEPMCDELLTKPDWDPCDFIRKDDVNVTAERSVVVEESCKEEVCASSCDNENDFYLLVNGECEKFELGCVEKGGSRPGNGRYEYEIRKDIETNVVKYEENAKVLEPAVEDLTDKPQEFRTEGGEKKMADSTLQKIASDENHNIMQYKHHIEPLINNSSCECKAKAKSEAKFFTGNPAVDESEAFCVNESGNFEMNAKEFILCSNETSINEAASSLDCKSLTGALKTPVEVGASEHSLEKANFQIDSEEENKELIVPKKRHESTDLVNEETKTAENNGFGHSLETKAAESKTTERKRFDSCPNLSFALSSKKDVDDVFASEIFEARDGSKERKQKGSFAKIKKQSQKRKPISEGHQMKKKCSFTDNCELERLKQDYDSTLAAFLKNRSKSLDDVIVSTQTISVSPADTSTSSIITPPPPDVINHSDSHGSSMDVTDDAFPTPPPDVITHTITTSPSSSTTVIETTEFVSSQQYPPEVETHTVVISSDGDTKGDFERMISSESVTTSETTISKIITTEVRTISSEQKIVISGEGEVSEELQQALKDAAENRADGE